MLSAALRVDRARRHRLSRWRSRTRIPVLSHGLVIRMNTSRTHALVPAGEGRAIVARQEFGVAPRDERLAAARGGTSDTPSGRAMSSTACWRTATARRLQLDGFRACSWRSDVEWTNLSDQQFVHDHVACHFVALTVFSIPSRSKVGWLYRGLRRATTFGALLCSAISEMMMSSSSSLFPHHPCGRAGFRHASSRQLSVPVAVGDVLLAHDLESLVA